MRHASVHTTAVQPYSPRAARARLFGLNHLKMEAPPPVLMTPPTTKEQIVSTQDTLRHEMMEPMAVGMVREQLAMQQQAVALQQLQSLLQAWVNDSKKFNDRFLAECDLMLMQCNKLHADCNRFEERNSRKRMFAEKPASEIIVYAETDQDEGVMYWQTDEEEEHEESLTAVATAAMLPGPQTPAQREQSTEAKRPRRHSTESTSDGTQSDGSNSSA